MSGRAARQRRPSVAAAGSLPRCPHVEGDAPRCGGTEGDVAVGDRGRLVRDVAGGRHEAEFAAGRSRRVRACRRDVARCTRRRSTRAARRRGRGRRRWCRWRSARASWSVPSARSDRFPNPGTKVAVVRRARAGAVRSCKRRRGPVHVVDAAELVGGVGEPFAGDDGPDDAHAAAFMSSRTSSTRRSGRARVVAFVELSRRLWVCRPRRWLCAALW